MPRIICPQIIFRDEETIFVRPGWVTDILMYAIFPFSSIIFILLFKILLYRNRRQRVLLDKSFVKSTKIVLKKPKMLLALLAILSFFLTYLSPFYCSTGRCCYMEHFCPKSTNRKTDDMPFRSAILLHHVSTPGLLSAVISVEQK